MQMYVSMTHEMKMRGIYAGIDCCCNAGSIAISNEAPLSSDIDKECKFKLRTIRGRLGGWLGGRLFRLHRYRTWWRRVSDGPSFGLKPRSSRGRPATGHIGDFRRSSPSSTRAGSLEKTCNPTARSWRHEDHRHQGMCPWGVVRVPRPPNGTKPESRLYGVA